MTQATSTIFGAPFVMLEQGKAPKARQIALVPGALAPVLALDLPDGLRGEAREQVARRQILDRIGLDDASVEMHPVHTPKERDVWAHVLLADTRNLNAWRKSAEACKAVLPDYLALPTAPNVWSIAATDSGIAVRMGPQDGFGADLAVAKAMIQRRLANAPPHSVIRLGPEIPEIEALFVEASIPVTNALSGAKTLGHGETAFDLRRDPRQARLRLRRKVLPWRWPVLIGTVAAAIWSAAMLIETRSIEDRTEALRGDTRALVRTHFVPDGPLLDVRTQVSRALSTRRAALGNNTRQATSLDLFARASDVISAQAAQPVSVAANAPGEVVLVLQVADFAAADSLADALRAVDLEVEIIQSRVSDGASGVRSEIRIRARRS